MSIYGNTATIDGVTCGAVIRGTENGAYLLFFEREYASMDQIEKINWEKPDIQGDIILPRDCGFTVDQILYTPLSQIIRVNVRMERRYFGDVTAYQQQIDALEKDKRLRASEAAARREQIASLEKQLAEADEELIAIYERTAVTVGAEPPAETAVPEGPTASEETETEPEEIAVTEETEAEQV